MFTDATLRILPSRMKCSPQAHSFAVVRFLTAALCLLAGIGGVKAENWQTFDIAAPAGRALHGFALQVSGQPVIPLSGSGLSDGGASPYLHLTLTVDVSQPGWLVLLDTTTGEAAGMVLANDNGISLTMPGENDFQPTGSSQPARYFFVPESRSGNPLFLRQPGGAFYPVSILSSPAISYYSANAAAQVTGYEGRAILDPSLPFWIHDSVTGENLEFSATDLVAGPWYAGNGGVPFEPVTVYLEGREQGHRFTVHSRASGGPGMKQSVQARGGFEAEWPAPNGGWTYDAAWNWVEVPAGSATLNFAVGRGMEFWITREADDAQAGGNGQMAIPPGSAGYTVANWLLYGVFPDPPQRATPLEPVTFRVNAQRWGHRFTVWQSDGYHFRFAANDPGRVNGQPDWNGSV